MTDDIIVKYLAGEASPTEIQNIAEWRALSKENELYFKSLEQTWELSLKHGNNTTPIDVDKAWTRFEKNKLKQKTLVFYLSNYWKVAASIVLALGLAYYFYQRPNSSEQMELALNGHNKKIVLSDSSEVILIGANIHCPKTFVGNKRTFYLDSGKAFFKVSKDSLKPFEIVANNTSILVLGTQFEVVSTKLKTSVNVLEGKVLFTTPIGSKILTSGMKCQYDLQGSKMDIEQQKNNNSLAYITHALIFNATPLREVIADLNQYQDQYFIKVKDENLLGCKLNAQFNNEKLEDIIKVISSTMQMKVNKVKDTLILEQGICSE